MDKAVQNREQKPNMDKSHDLGCEGGGGGPEQRAGGLQKICQLSISIAEEDSETVPDLNHQGTPRRPYSRGWTVSWEGSQVELPPIDVVLDAVERRRKLAVVLDAVESPAEWVSRHLHDVTDLDKEARQLSKEHRLDLHEVKWILESLQARELDAANGILNLQAFSGFLARALHVQCVSEDLSGPAFEISVAEDGRVNVRKFLLWYQSKMFSDLSSLTVSSASQASDVLVLRLAKRYNLSAVGLHKIKAVFDKFDLDKSGSIEFPEFDVMMVQLMGITRAADLPKIRVQRFWKEANQNTSGALDFPEFIGFYIKYFASESDGVTGAMEAFYSNYSPRRGSSLPGRP